MFEVPEAKRVRRADLDVWSDAGDQSESEGYDAELQARLNAQIARSLGITQDFVQPAPAAVEAKLSHSTKAEATMIESSDEGGNDTSGKMEDETDAGEEEFAFRLFSTTQPTQKVVLEEDAGPTGDGTFTTKRPLSYYVASHLTEAQRQQYLMAAVTGEDVLERSKDRSWGFEMPWKVTRIAITRKGKPGESTTLVVKEDAATRKRRPGKKQRISLRRRAKAKEEKKKALEQKALEKEDHIKEKKKRLNRLKKLRRRAKNKDAKLVADGSQIGGGDEDAESDGSE
ncbi:hypothetical protein BGZ63DRAFT_385117 [Mariannaea sp. PMI_226]|nr:hypothetical protein BGZ63DRAFT_385117 [Mariannaea sp. PMI_226]